MNWKDAKDIFMVALIVLVASCFTSQCAYELGKDYAKTEVAKELCSKTEYDFCVKVPQRSIYTLKNDID